MNDEARMTNESSFNFSPPPALCRWGNDCKLQGRSYKSSSFPHPAAARQDAENSMVSF
jgi:hypothetical protein